MNTDDRIRVDHFFARGRTIAQLEQLAQDEHSDSISFSDLSLDWALDGADRQTERIAAQYQSRDGALIYAVPLGPQIALVSSDGNVVLRANDGHAATRSTLSTEGIRRYRRKEQIRLPDVINRVRELLIKHIQFGEAWQPDLISLWVTGTFLYSIFDVFGYLHITSASKRCGKSLLLDLMTHLCFNATSPSTNPSPAFVFRDADRNCGTQLLDEVERLTSADQKRHPSLMAILNAGFKRGGRVPRISDSKTNSVYDYNVYAPRALAGINSLSTTLSDRCFRIELIRKRSGEKIARFSSRHGGNRLTRLRDDLHLAALQYADKICHAYNHGGNLGIQDIDDRLRDIVEPLFAIAVTSDKSEGTSRYTNAAVKAARALSDLRTEKNAIDPARIKMLKILEHFIVQSNCCDVVVSSKFVEQLLTENGNLGSLKKTRGLLRKLGFRSAVHRLARFNASDHIGVSKETARGYEIKLESIRKMLSVMSH